MKVFYVLLCLLLSGCLSKGDIFNHQSLSDSSITTMDARQRSILANRIKDNPTFLRLCAEPYPDIFTVVSSSLSAGLDAEAGAEKDKSAKLKVAAQIAQALKESGASIDRSQTVNLINMSLYRTCERFMNGGISEAELKFQAARDQQAMVSILAIEQLTNIARPAPTKIILDSGFAEAVASNIVSSEAAKKALDAAKVNYEKTELLKKSALSKSKQTVKCDFDDTVVQKTCTDATDSFNSAGHALNKAQADFDKESSSPISATAKVGSNQTTHIVINDNRKPDVDSLSNETVKHIANAVVKLAEIGTKFDCEQYKAINPPKSSQDSRSCSGTGGSDGEKLGVAEFTWSSASEVEKPSTSEVEKKCPAIKNSNIIFYVQAQKNCEKCEKSAEDAKVIINTLLHEKCESLVSYPIEYLDSKNMPNKSEVRYFDESDKLAAEAIAESLDVKAKYFRLNATSNVVEYWVGKE